MSTLQNLKIALKEALEREQALIESIEEGIAIYFSISDRDRALAIFRDYVDAYEAHVYIPNLKAIERKIDEEKANAAEWRAKQEAAKSTSS